LERTILGHDTIPEGYSVMNDGTSGDTADVGETSPKEIMQKRLFSKGYGGA